MRKIILPLLIICIVAIKNIALAAELPAASAENFYAADFAKMIDSSTKEKILAMGRQLRADYKAQVVVVTIDTLGDSSIEDYANALFRKWGIGDKELNNGVLLLIAKNDRKFRIEVGYGLEGAITDGYAGEILDGMTNYFREENYSEGILQAYSKLTKKIYEEYGAEVPENVAENTGEDFTAFEIIMIGFFVLIIGATFIKMVVVIFLTIFAYIYNALKYAVSGGRRGTLNPAKVFHSTYLTVSDIAFFAMLDSIKSSSGSSGSGFGGGSSGGDSGGGGSSGGGGASGGW